MENSQVIEFILLINGGLFVVGVFIITVLTRLNRKSINSDIKKDYNRTLNN